MKLGLGTVQFGLDYGVSNPDGRTTEAEARKILDVADQAGVEYVDTAHQYGKSEAVLGACMPRGHRFKIVTKTPKFRTCDEVAVAECERAFENSLRLLRVDCVYALLAHDADDLLGAGGDRIFAAMARFKHQGCVTRIGASVYTASQIDGLLSRYPIDIIQAPVSLLDQRLVKSGHLDELSLRGTEVHARSIFLQGLIFLNPEHLPAHFRLAIPRLTAMRKAMQAENITLEQAALAYVASLSAVSVAVCGVNRAQQFADLIRAAESAPGLAKNTKWNRFAIDEPSIVNPRLWPSRMAL